MKNARSSILQGMALLAAVFALWFFLFREYRTEIDAQQRVVLERGETILEALTAGIRAQTRMGRYRAEHLQEAFEALAEAPDIDAIRLLTSSGEEVISLGTWPESATTNTTAAIWTDAYLLLCGECVFTGDGHYLEGVPQGRGGMGGGRGRGQGYRGGANNLAALADENAWGEEPLTLCIVLDAHALADKARRIQVKYLLGAGITLVLSLLAWLMLLGRSRQRALLSDLAMAEEQSAHHARLAQLGAGLAHETKNPLGLVRGLAQSICDADGLPPQVREQSLQIVDETDRIVGQINGFLSLSSPHPPKLDTVQLAPLFQHLVRLIQQEAQEQGVEISAETPPWAVSADENQLRRGLLNLLINALRACKSNDHIRLTASMEHGAISISVRDTGCGIAPEDLPHIKEPYFTRFPQGTGLGLAVVEATARAHGWKVHITSHLNAGTEVTLTGLHQVH